MVVSDQHADLVESSGVNEIANGLRYLSCMQPTLFVLVVIHIIILALARMIPKFRGRKEEIKGGRENVEKGGKYQKQES